MQLTQISKITGKIELITGLHIGSGNTEIHIGGTDNPVIKNPINQQPYIPGSSIKGKMRSLLEWHSGLVGDTKGAPVTFKDIEDLNDETKKEQAKQIIKLFGGAPDNNIKDELINEIGPTRLAFWDCALDEKWVKDMEEKSLMLTETKMENSIDRIKGTAENPRNTERVPATAVFDFNLTIRVHDNEEDVLDTLITGLKLLELTGLGGSGSRGYGKIKFKQLKLDDADIQDKLDNFSFNEA
jgi:CRISPR-associated protein Csm3